MQMAMRLSYPYRSRSIFWKQRESNGDMGDTCYPLSNAIV